MPRFLMAILAASLAAAASAAETLPLRSAEGPAATRQEVFARPGRLVRLPDGRRINLRCSGAGAPTVVLEAGFAASSSAWGKVQPRIAASTRVCSYDRAGYGFSDVGSTPRDGAAIARDLDGALKAAGVRGPFIVAGHSAGGLYARLFAARRLHEIAGLVLVDPSVEHQDQRLAAMLRPGAGSVEGIHRRVARCLEAVTAPLMALAERDRAGCVPKSADAHAWRIALRPGTWRTQLSEIDTLFAETSNQVDRVGGLLKAIPAIVLTAEPTEVPPGPENPQAAAWRALHGELASRFERGEQRLVKSGHLMMSERPDAVSGAVLELVAASRGKQDGSGAGP